MAIYTRTGDTGTTSLFGGKRILKCEELVDVYGSIDELNSWIGKIDAAIESPDASQFLRAIQEDLFVIGSHLAGWATDLHELPMRVKEMEARMDIMESSLPALRHFIIPGGTPLAATIHLARSVCRRVERQAVAYNQRRSIDPRVLVYLNRLSDLLFMLARFVNHEAGSVEMTWRGIDRKTEKK